MLRFLCIGIKHSQQEETRKSNSKLNFTKNRRASWSLYSQNLKIFFPRQKEGYITAHYFDRSHDFYITISRCHKDVYDNRFFPCRAGVWNFLHVECFPLTYNLSGFKSRIKTPFNSRFFPNRFPVGFHLFVLVFLVPPCLMVAVLPCMEWIPIKKIIQKGTPPFKAELTTILVLIGTVFVVIWEMFHGGISLNLVLLLLVLILWVGPGWN